MSDETGDGHMLDPEEAMDLEEAWRQVTPDAARRLLIAAVRSFSERGFHATTTRHLSAAAGMSPAGVYVHYRSKEELLYRIALIGHTGFGRLVEAAASQPDPATQLSQMMRDMTEWQARYHATVRVVEYELPSLSPEHLAEITAIRRDIHRTVCQILSSGVATGAFDIPAITPTASALMSLVADVGRWFPARHGASPRQLGEFYADLALRLVT